MTDGGTRFPQDDWIHVGECPCEACRKGRIAELVEREREVLERLAEDD